LRIAVVGAGHLGRYHARLLRPLPGVELVGVVDPHEPARRALAQELGVAAWADLEDVSGRLDAAVLAAPTCWHHRLGVRLLERGIHLLVEKPLASTAAQAQELVDLAARQGLVLQVGHVERFNPAFQAALAHLEKPKYIEAARLSGYSFRSTDIGVVLDLMIHDLDLALALIDAPLRSVAACGATILGGHEDVAKARLEFENGAVATLSASRASFVARRTMQVWTPRLFAGLDFSTRGVTLVRPSAELLAGGLAGAGELTPQRRECLKQRLFEELLPIERFEAPATNALADELADFVDSVRRLRRPRVSGADGLRAVAAAEQVLAQIAAHDWSGGQVQPDDTPATHALRGPHWRLEPGHTPPRPRRREAG
jgi:predicted dehydrogenase